MNSKKFLAFWIALYFCSVVLIYFLFENFEAIVFWTIGYSWQVLFKFPKFIRHVLKRKKKFALLNMIIVLTFKLKNERIPFWIIILSIQFLMNLILSLVLQSDLLYWVTLLGGITVEIVNKEIGFIQRVLNKEIK